MIFSSNTYTRRRQQKAAAFFSISGVLAAVGLNQVLRAPIVPPQALAEATPDLASFGRIALAPSGEVQVELVGRQVRLREVATQRLMTVQEIPNAQAVRFSPDGSKVLVHTLYLQGIKLQDTVIAFDARGTWLSK